jgi:hypothetical protein
MKKIKTLLRYWIASASIMGFLFGWIMFAHSSKPVSLTGQTNQASSSAITTGSQSLISIPQSQQIVQPRLRTGGS